MIRFYCLAFACGFIPDPDAFVFSTTSPYFGLAEPSLEIIVRFYFGVYSNCA